MTSTNEEGLTTEIVPERAKMLRDNFFVCYPIVSCVFKNEDETTRE